MSSVHCRGPPSIRHAARRDAEAARRQHRIDEAAAQIAKKQKEEQERASRQESARHHLLDDARAAVEKKIAEEEARAVRKEK